MLSLEDIRLIEPYDETPPRRCPLSVVQSDQQIEAPIHQPTGFHIALLTILLAAFGTPICYVVYFNAASDQNRFGLGVLVSVVWVLGVIGPAAFWLFWPIGILRPDHWIRFDRESGLLSLKGGFSEFRRDEIAALLSVTDLRKKKRQTEFQIVTGCPGAFAKHFVANCRELDPQIAFGTVIQEIGRFSGIPYYFAMIDSDGKISIDGSENADEPSDPPKSPVGREFES